MLELKNVRKTFNRGTVNEKKALCGVNLQLNKGDFKGYRLGLLYGKQKSIEKEKTIKEFYSNNTQILISTTVIEVGINVVNANIIVIENADRFGLAQLHQLRGRVGRDGSEAWCFVMTKPNKKLEMFCSTTDGFELSKIDFQIRGPGEVLGLNQHGSSYFSSLLMDKSAEFYVNISKNILDTILYNDAHKKFKNQLNEETDKLSLELEETITLS